MNGFNRGLSVLLAVGMVSLCCVSCKGDANKVSKQQEAEWRQGPPKTPPSEFKGNTLGSPGAAPPGSGSVKGGPGGPPPDNAKGPGNAGGNPPAGK